MQPITQYEGLYGDARANPDAEYLFVELLETRSKDFEWTIRPHIHRRLLQVFFIESGTFEFFDSGPRRQLKAPCILIIPPASLHGMNYQGAATGRIVTMSVHMLDTILAMIPGLALMTAGVQCLSEVSPDSLTSFRQIFSTLERESGNNWSGRRAMLSACLQQLFLQLYRIWLQDQEKTAGPDHQALQHFRKFLELTRRASARQTVAAVAAQMNMTPVHLNRICKSVAGRSAGDLMQEHILEEARKYLLYTAYSISEVAYELDFEYPNYFARFFRKHAGISPTEFRKQPGGVVD